MGRQAPAFSRAGLSRSGRGLRVREKPLDKLRAVEWNEYFVEETPANQAVWVLFK